MSEAKSSHSLIVGWVWCDAHAMCHTDIPRHYGKVWCNEKYWAKLYTSNEEMAERWVKRFGGGS